MLLPLTERGREPHEGVLLARLKLPKPSICERFRLCASFVNVRFLLALRHSGVWARRGALHGETLGSYQACQRAHACEVRFLQGAPMIAARLRCLAAFLSPMFHVKHRGFLFVPWCDLCAVFVDGYWLSLRSDDGSWASRYFYILVFPDVLGSVGLAPLS